MGLASIGGRQLRIDPTTVAWEFTTKATETLTIGGKVVQVFGTRLTDMTVRGRFGSWAEQEDFLAWVKDVGAKQALNPPPPPMRFTYPPMRLSFSVYLKSFAQPGAPASVYHSPEIVAPEWELTLFIEDDYTGLAKVATDRYIERISEGLGWAPSKYNGPLDQSEVETLVRGATVTGDIREYLIREREASADALISTASSTLPPAGTGLETFPDIPPPTQ